MCAYNLAKCQVFTDIYKWGKRSDILRLPLFSPVHSSSLGNPVVLLNKQAGRWYVECDGGVEPDILYIHIESIAYAIASFE